MSARDRAAAGEETPAATRRTDEEVFTRPGIEVRMYGSTHYIPVLPRRASREWRERFQGTLRTIWGGVQGLEQNANGTAELFGIADSVLDAAAEMVAAYDRDGVLGGTEQIDARATDEEVWEAAKAIASYVYPFGKDLARFPQLLDTLLTATATAQSATSTDSQSGDGGSAPDG